MLFCWLHWSLFAAEYEATRMRVNTVKSKANVLKILFMSDGKMVLWMAGRLVQL